MCFHFFSVMSHTKYLQKIRVRVKMLYGIKKGEKNVAYISYFFLFSFQPKKRSLKIILLEIIMMLSYKSIDWSEVSV